MVRASGERNETVVVVSGIVVDVPATLDVVLDVVVAVCTVSVVPTVVDAELAESPALVQATTSRARTATTTRMRRTYLVGLVRQPKRKLQSSCYIYLGIGSRHPFTRL